MDSDSTYRWLRSLVMTTLCFAPIAAQGTDKAPPTSQPANTTGAANQFTVLFEYAERVGSILIRARINRQRTLLIVDTGSSHTVLVPKLVGMKAHEVAPAQLSRPDAGFLGDAVGQEVTLELGGQVWTHRRIAVMDLSQILASYKEPIGGVLGLDFFKQFSQVTVNLKEQTITCVR